MAIRDNLVIKMKPVLSRFLDFVENCVSENEIDEEEVLEMKILVERHAEYKHAFHLALCIFLEDDDVQQIFSDEANEDILYCLTERVDEDLRSLSREKYWKIVTDVGLVEECLSMIVAKPCSPIMAETCGAIVSTIIQEKERFSKNIYDLFVTAFVKLIRVGNEEIGEMYLGPFRDLLRFVLSSSVFQNHEVLGLLLRLAGIAILRPQDFQESGEISALLSEWQFDNLIAENQSFILFRTLVCTESIDKMQKRFDSRVLSVLDELLFKMELHVDNVNENVLEETISTSSNMSWLDFIGGCAYLVSLISQKLSVDLSRFPSLLKLVDEWSAKKPKMKEEDFKQEGHDFQEFCKRMNEYGKRDQYQRDWMERFMSYPPNEIFGSHAGLDIADKFIVKGHDFDIVFKYVESAYRTNSELTEDARRLILKVLFFNETAKINTDRLVQVFSNGVSDKFRTSTFASDLNTLCMQLTNIEYEKDVNEIEVHESTVIGLCFQDPVTAISRLLEQSIRTHHFRALEFARPFFRLGIDRKGGDVHENKLYGILITNCLSFLVKNGIQTDLLQGCLKKAIGTLISSEIVSGEEMFYMLRYRILRLLQDCLSSAIFLKVFKISEVVEGLVAHLVNEIDFEDNSPSQRKLKEIILDVNNFVIKINRFFCLHTNNSTFANSMKVRDRLVTILEHLKQSKIIQNQSISLEIAENIEDKGLLELGILYVRCPELRPLIENFHKEDDITDSIDFTRLVRYVVEWVANSCDAEWSSLRHFIFNVIWNARSMRKLSKVYMLNVVLLSMYLLSIETKVPDVFLHGLKFYATTVEVFEEAGDVKENERFDLLNALINLACTMVNLGKGKRGKTTSEGLGLHQILLLLLSKIEKYIKTGQAVPRWSYLQTLFYTLPKVDSKCESIRILITKNLKNLSNPVTA